MNKRQTGTVFEKIAVNELKKQGYEIIETNFRCHIGEIDIIGRDNGYLVFIEVKYRKNKVYGYPEEAVNYKKINTIKMIAMNYLKYKNISFDTPVRFDVLAIEGESIRLIKNAFNY